MSLVETLRKDMFGFVKVGDTDKSEIIKIALAEVKNVEIDLDKTLSDDEVIGVLRKEVKKINDSIEQFEKMGREDLVSKEKEQLGVINSYLPALMTKDDVEVVVRKKIEELGAKDMRDMGKVIGSCMQELKGEADGAVVKELVQSLLS